MPDVTAVSKPSNNPLYFDYFHLGTATGTTTILSEPCVLHAVTVNERAASGAIVLYDSIGTSATVIGSIVLGTQTFSDPVRYEYNIRTTTALSVVHPNNVDLTVAAI